jgi:hypothetical protein
MFFIVPDMTIFPYLTGNVEGHSGEQWPVMIYGTYGEKRLTYSACGRCGRIYSVADHRECPDCHGRHSPRIEGCTPGFDFEEAPSLQAPGKRF